MMVSLSTLVRQWNLRGVVMLFLGLLSALSSNAQMLDYGTNEEDSHTILSTINGHQGEFRLEGVSVQVDLPDEFIFLDEKVSEDILINYWGNQANSVSDVIGMIVPSSVTAIDDIYSGWIVSYLNVGHVEDSKAGKMGFSWIIDKLKESHKGEYTNIEWSGTPKYDTQQHRLSLPLAYIKGNDTIYYHRQYLFGNTGLIVIEPISNIGDISKLIEDNERITRHISFTQGGRYEDFDPQTQINAYNSVSSFLTSGSGSSQESEAQPSSTESDTPSFSDLVIRYIGVSAGIVVAIMLILMLLVKLTNSKVESSRSIKLQCVNVLLRLSVFGTVYILAFIFAIFLIWAGVWLTIEMLKLYISIRSLIIIFAGWVIIGGFLWAIIKSLFVFKHSDNSDRFEISLADEPELELLLKEVSESVGEQMPKHVYITHNVNACVFYDNTIQSIFSNGRKNLEIGLGLLFGMNRQELKAVLAHEYGHFGQKSMRIGQITSIFYTIFSNLVTDGGAFILDPIFRRAFAYVQRGFMTLSRAMEYEADEKSAAIAGSTAAISALCKLEVMSSRQEGYNTLFTTIYTSKQILPTSYWSGYINFLTLTDDFDGIILNESITATGPMIKTPPSRVKLKNPWISHPLLEQRIENICKSATDIPEYDKVDAKSIISHKTFEQSSNLLISELGYNSGTVYSDEQYKDMLVQKMGELSFPRKLRVFFDRDICEFDLNTTGTTAVDDSETVFSESNAQTVSSFNQAISDYRIMMMFKNKQTTEKEIQYEGKVYSRKNVPVDTQLKIAKLLELKARSIDQDIFALAMTISPDKDLIMTAYENIFYSQAVIRHIGNNIIPVRDSIAQQTGSGGEMNEDTFKRIQAMLLHFKANIKEMIDSLQMERLNPVMHVDTAKEIKKIENSWLLDGPSISGEELQYIFSLPDLIIAQFQNLAYYSKKIVSDTIEGNKPLMAWENSVALSL